jgi:aerobic-type carbon monoxide dehydrogenase small subunit (CoxS/CutS family)
VPARDCRGRTVYSCSTLAIEVQGKQIRTVDGLANGNAASGAAGLRRYRRSDVRLLHARVRDGDRRAPRTDSNPTLEQAKKGLDGNICRCGTFVRIMEAALKAKGGSCLKQTRA